MKAFIISTTLAGIVLCCSGIYGQNAVSGAISSDLPTRKIITIPQLQPPKEAIESGIGGNVRVKITIDDEGNVTSVDDVVGPGAVCRGVARADVVAMRNSAKAAAATAKFAPASRPTGAFSTWLNFNFPGSEEESNYVAGASDPQSEGASYTVIPGTAAETPSDYKGPVNTGGKTETNLPKTVAGGVLNGRANELPKPPYPAAARAVRATGSVPVQVLIDEKGEIFMAKAVGGHPLLRSASVTAACEARFSPTRLSGHPVKVAGIITYNFVP